MKKVILFLFVLIAFAACKNEKNTPDISGIKVSLAVQRFDEDFFSLDTTNVQRGLANLQAKYPVLLPVFLENIVGVTSQEGINTFYRLYKPVFDSSQKIYKDFASTKTEIEKAFRYVKYYFPGYKTPGNIIPIVGPMNSLNDMAKMSNGDLTPNFIGPDFLGVSLQFYLGKNFSLYNQEYFINNVVPLYRSRRFSKEYIIADVMKLVADDIFPDKSSTRPLIEQMIEKGKQWWLIDKFLPETPEKYQLEKLRPLISYGASPRGSINLALASKAQAFLNKRGFVIPEDVRSICNDVLRHRIGLTYEAEAENVKVEDIIEDILKQVNVP